MQHFKLQKNNKQNQTQKPPKKPEQKIQHQEVYLKAKTMDRKKQHEK